MQGGDNPVKAQALPLARQIVARHVKRNQIESDDSWRGAPELPTAEELLRREPTLFPEHGPTYTKDAYLEKQYKSYRHEGIELLRRSINSYRRSKTPDKNTYLYSHARVRGYTFSRQGAACRIAFSTRDRVDWFDPDEGRLKVGSLVALSNDHFTSQCLVGVVAARPVYGGLVPDRLKGENDWTPPRIDIFWSRTEESVWDPAEEMVMIEARSAYYEPVRHAMLGLQHAASEESRFDKYLVHEHKKDPECATCDDGRNMTDPASAIKLDVSQEAAFRRMNIKEMAIIQGPPGTGKTFTSVVALEALVPRQPTPLIISAHTNHALDQLLRECLNSDIVIARLGSRTQDEAIEKRTMYNIAKDNKSVRKPFGQQADRQRSQTVRSIEEALGLCFPWTGGLVSAKTFRDKGIITQEQLDSLDEDGWETAGDDGAGANYRISPDGIEPGMEEDHQQAEDNLLVRWLAAEAEQDRSHLYQPLPSQHAPAGPLEAADAIDASYGSDLEEGEGPIRKVTTAPEEKNRKLDGQFLSLHHGLTGSVQGKQGVTWWNNKARQLLKENDDLYVIQSYQRGGVYRYLRKRLIQQVSDEILRTKLQEYNATCEDIRINQDCYLVDLIQSEKIRVIGCTTTGLNKYRGILKALQPRVLLVEEAAETHEPNISSALFPSLKQLILVGDHQQLAPSVKIEDMKDFGLNVSLFERLVKSRVPFSRLEVQRRMAPPIRQVVQAFYPSLRDHEIVGDPTERPPIQGIDHRVWWFQHRWPDSREQTSSINVDEARMIIRLYQYLVQNGLNINQVTILSFYKAQVERIKFMLSKDVYFKRFRRPQGSSQEQPKPSDWDSVVRTVDGFQGEQNEVIILSAVRSCSSSGFVAVENRAVVALSRAKCGMYVFGNEETLLGDEAGRATWGKVWDLFVQQAMRGESFPITCVKHERVTEIHDPETWSTCKDGGCDLPCEDNHCSDHTCQLSCHPPGREVICRQPCEKLLPCKHKCGRICGNTCKCASGCDEPALKENLRLTRPIRNVWNTTLPVRDGVNAPSSSDREPEVGAVSNFREKFCGLIDGDAPPSLSSTAAHVPVIKETFTRTAVDANGSHFVAEETTHQHHGELLIDFSTPDEEPQTVQSPPGWFQEEIQQEVQEDSKTEEDTQEDWLIEL